MLFDPHGLVRDAGLVNDAGLVIDAGLVHDAGLMHDFGLLPQAPKDGDVQVPQGDLGQEPVHAGLVVVADWQRDGLADLGRHELVGVDNVRVQPILDDEADPVGAVAGLAQLVVVGEAAAAVEEGQEGTGGLSDGV